jgi:hypothetical protein
MNEHGYYEGYQDFTVKFSLTKSLSAFEFQFNGNQYLAQKHMLRDYLKDTIYSAVNDTQSIYSLILSIKGSK